MHRPYRDIAKETDMENTPLPAKPLERRRISRKEPLFSRSTLINFSAIALLFAIIFALQQVSASISDKGPGRDAVQKAAVVDMEEIEAKAAEEAKAAHKTKIAMNAMAAQSADFAKAPTVAVEVIPASVILAAEKQKAVAASESDVATKTAPLHHKEAATPIPDTKAMAAAIPAEATDDAVTENKSTTPRTKKTTAERTTEKKPAPAKISTQSRPRRTVRTASRSRRKVSDPHWQDKQMRVEDLDNPSARQHYHTLNNDLSPQKAQPYTQAPVATTVTTPTYQPARAPRTYAEYDLDSEAARQRYRAETENLLLGTNADN